MKDIIKYNDKEYELSTVYLDDYAMFETMIFPMKNNIVCNNEVYCFRTFESEESKNKHVDIYFHPEEYVSDEAIYEYLKSQDENYGIKDIEFPMKYLQKYMLGELTFDEAVDNTLEEIRILIKEHLYNG
jgi:hypothetical protein